MAPDGARRISRPFTVNPAFYARQKLSAIPSDPTVQQHLYNGYTPLGIPEYALFHTIWTNHAFTPSQRPFRQMTVISLSDFSIHSDIARAIYRRHIKMDDRSYYQL